MKAFLSAVVVALVMAIGAAYILDSNQRLSSDAYTSADARVGDPGTNLIGY